VSTQLLSRAGETCENENVARFSSSWFSLTSRKKVSMKFSYQALRRILRCARNHFNGDKPEDSGFENILPNTNTHSSQKATTERFLKVMQRAIETTNNCNIKRQGTMISMVERPMVNLVEGMLWPRILLRETPVISRKISFNGQTTKNLFQSSEDDTNT
jgi:hypothetical protein